MYDSISTHSYRYNFNFLIDIFSLKLHCFSPVLMLKVRSTKHTIYFIIKHFYILLNSVLHFMHWAAIRALGVRKISPAAVKY